MSGHGLSFDAMATPQQIAELRSRREALGVDPEHIAAIVDDAPQLTEEQRAALGLLWRKAMNHVDDDLKMAG